MSWNTFKQHYLSINELDFALDYSRIRFSNDFFQANEAKMQSAFKAMDALEAGSIANPDEGRQVGHYWLRNAELAPDSETQKAITEALETIDSIVEKVHSGSCAGESGAFKHLLIIGMGGSALGPQFVADALGGPKNDRINTFYFDNTDPDGMDRTLDRLEGQLGQTLSVVISKSGGTAETRNGMIEAKNAYTKAGLDFAKHAIAITGEGSKLDSLAVEENWLYRLPMWDWVGGRTSELATVGLLPAALQGIKIGDLLNGAKAMDGATRIKETRKNPAALLALSWYQATEGKGSKDMVILPYKDRLVLFSKYLQQLIMESLGKETDLDGTVVNQGIAVYGNKGSTDQHAYVQQLREGVNNFFVTFIEVLKDRKGASISVDEVGNSTGDYLHGFYLGTREALDEKDRETLTVTIKEVNAHSIGQLIALFERAVGLYAHLININAYHQPGVEAGKKAATNILKMKQTVCELLEKESPSPLSVDAIAEKTSLQNNEELIFKILYRLAHNSASNIQITSNTCPTEAEFYSQ
jgi:glucose-6-phosphate isomerase